MKLMQSGKYNPECTCFFFLPEYIFQINTILVNERKVGTSCRVKEVPECIIWKASALDSFVWSH